MVAHSFPETAPRRRRVPARAGIRAAWIGLACLLASAGVARGSKAREEDRAAALQERRDTEEARLDTIRSEIEDLRRRLAGTEARAGSVLDEIEELDLRVALLSHEASALRQETAQVREREGETRNEAAEIARRITESERSLESFLREVYKVGPTRYVRIVAASASPAQFAAGQRAVEAMSLGESRRIDDYRADRVRLDAALAELARQGEELGRLQEALRGKEKELRAGREGRAEVLIGLKRERESQRQSLDQLVGLEKEIQTLLDGLARPGGSGPVPSLGFVRFRGLLAWPARGRLVEPFGKERHPRFNTVVPHPGIDIAAPSGQDVRAVFDGRVVFSNWFKGYGEMVVIDHGDGYLSVYGHVSDRRVMEGQDVKQGDVIARSGEGGAFETAGVYFEIRHDGKPEDPARWLRAAPGRAAGRMSASRRSARGSRSTH